MEDFYLFLNGNNFSNDQSVEKICMGLSYKSMLYFHLYLDKTVNFENKNTSVIKSLINLLNCKPRIPVKTLSLNSNRMNLPTFVDLLESFPEWVSKDESYYMKEVRGYKESKEKEPEFNYNEEVLIAFKTCEPEKESPLETFISLYDNKVSNEVIIDVLKTFDPNKHKLKLLVDYFYFNFNMDSLFKKDLEKSFHFIDYYSKKKKKSKYKKKKQ